MRELVPFEATQQPAVRPYFHQDNVLTPLRHASGVALARWRLVLVTSLVVFTAIMALALLWPHNRYAQALVIMHPDQTNLALDSEQQNNGLPDTSAVDTEVEILRSPAVASDVVKKLRLYQDPEFGGQPGADPTTELMRKVLPVVMDHSRIRRVGLTYAVQVGFIAHSVEKAKQIADTIVSTYLSRKLNQKLEQVTRANKELGQTLEGLRERAHDAQARLQKYEFDNGLLDTNRLTLAENELSALNQQIADAQAVTANRSALVAAARAQAQHGGGGSDVGDTLDAQTLASRTLGILRQREAEANANLARLKAQFRPAYPPVQQAEAQLDSIRNQIGSETHRILSTLNSQAIGAAKKEASLVESRDRILKEIQKNNEAKSVLLTLEQSAESAKTIYQTYLKRASDVTAQRGLQQVDATVDSKAVAEPRSPFSDPKLVAIVAAILAAIASIFVLVFSELWTPRVRSAQDVALQTGLPVAGILPEVKAKAQLGNPAKQLAEQPFTAVAEAFRSLAGYLQISLSPERSKIIAITSAIPGEGKTFASVCLASTLTGSGKRVVLLDCDLRRASASRFFGKPEFGIEQILDGTVSVDEALIHDAKSGLWFLRGTAGRNIPGNLFAGSRIDQLLAKLSEKFDHIVIDLPPLLGFADARLLVSKADRVVHLVQWNRTPNSLLRASLEILEQSNARDVNVVLNKVNIRQQSLYGFGDGSDYLRYYGTSYPELT